MNKSDSPATATDALLADAAERAAAYVRGMADRRVSPGPDAVEALVAFDTELSDTPTDAREVIRMLDELGSPGTVATNGPRFFGLVIGSSLPAATAASWLATAWDQNAGLVVASPTNAMLEQVAAGWVLDLMGLPATSGVGFVTGATAASFTAVCAARHELMRRKGWDVEAKGLFGAPPIRVIVGSEVHVSVLKALSLAGLGRERVETVAVDDQGRMRADLLPELDDHTLVCTQAGNVNTGAFDPIADICEAARKAGAWVHVDGAFGLWARACPTRAHLCPGMELADSWAVDCHKWLNVPYDSGLAICRDPAAMTRGLAMPASYLIHGGGREPYAYTPELSRRARGVEVWATLKSLGRSGVADLVERCCRHATRFADGLAAAGCEILNEVELNQVLVSFGTPAQTDAVIAAIQAEGTCWCGGTTWQGRRAMRISVSSWMTTEEDVDRSLAAMVGCARNVLG